MTVLNWVDFAVVLKHLKLLDFWVFFLGLGSNEALDRVLCDARLHLVEDLLLVLSRLGNSCDVFTLAGDGILCTRLAPLQWLLILLEATVLFVWAKGSREAI